MKIDRLRDKPFCSLYTSDMSVPTYVIVQRPVEEIYPPLNQGYKSALQTTPQPYQCDGRSLVDGYKPQMGCLASRKWPVVQVCATN